MNFGRYRAGKKLGEGSLGIVYEGLDGDKVVAVKILRPEFGKDPRLVKGCIDLGHALTLLSQPEIARLYEAGKLPDARVYVVSEYVPGESLTARLRRSGGPMAPNEALLLTRRVATVLAAAQKKGLVHLALKPPNIMLLDDGPAGKSQGGERIKILDLGLCRLVGEPAARVRRGAPGYLAPEQIEQDPAVGGQADVYALGILLYEMLAGRLPQGSGLVPPTPLIQLVPTLSKDIVALVAAMTARPPDKRPSMADVATRITQMEEELLIGQSIGNYRVVGKLGEGGMGTVFRAVNEQIGRPAAIKVMRQQFAQNAELAKRFLNEARAVNLIHHPSLVEIFEFGQLQSGAPYLVMEFLEGESLQQRRGKRGGSVPEPEARNLIRQVALAVAAAHAKGIIHRDLKPDNVMIIPDPIAPGGERTKLLDFGIAKVSTPVSNTGGPDGDATQLDTHVSSLMGTPTYMAPEQFSGAGSVTDKTDVYALGVILYELLAGKRPYPEVGLLPMSDPPPPLRSVAPRVSIAVAMLAQRMLSFRPTDRPAMSEVAERLGDAMLSPAEGIPIEEIDFEPTVPEPYPPSLAAGVAAGAASKTSRPPRPPADALRQVPISLPGVLGSGPARFSSPIATGPGPDDLTKFNDIGAANLRPDSRRWLMIGGSAVAAVILIAIVVHNNSDSSRSTRRPAQLQPPVVAEALPARPVTPETRPLPAAKPVTAEARPPAAEARPPAGAHSALGAAALATLRESLRDPDAAIRAGAAAALGATRDGHHQALLEPLLRDGDPVVQSRAAEALGQIGARGAVPQVVTLLEKTLDGDTFVRAAAALSELQDPRGPRRLREALQAKETAVKFRAAVFLTDRGDADGKRMLARLAQQPGLSAESQAEAMAHLARGGDAAAREGLSRLLQAPESNPEAKIAAADALAQLGDEEGRLHLLRIASNPGPQQILSARRSAGLGDRRFDVLFEQVAADTTRPLSDRLRALEGLSTTTRSEDELLGKLLSPGQGSPRLRLKAAETALLLGTGRPKK